MTTSLADRLEALAGKATAGPWVALCGKSYTRIYTDTEKMLKCLRAQIGSVQIADIAGPSDNEIRPWNGERWEADAALIVELRNALPTIIAALRKDQP
jgi:hypothetical protein